MNEPFLSPTSEMIYDVSENLIEFVPASKIEDSSTVIGTEPHGISKFIWQIIQNNDSLIARIRFSEFRDAIVTELAKFMDIGVSEFALCYYSIRKKGRQEHCSAEEWFYQLIYNNLAKISVNTEEGLISFSFFDLKADKEWRAAFPYSHFRDIFLLSDTVEPAYIKLDELSYRIAQLITQAGFKDIESPFDTNAYVSFIVDGVESNNITPLVDLFSFLRDLALNNEL